MPGLPVGALQDKHFGMQAWSTSEVCQRRQGAVLKTAILEQDEALSGRRFLLYQPQNAFQCLPQRQFLSPLSFFLPAFCPQTGKAAGFRHPVSAALLKAPFSSVAA